MRFRFNKNKSQPEKITKYSIRKFHFGAASVAIASLLFFGNGSVQAADNVVSSATGNPNTHQSEHTTSSGGKASGCSDPKKLDQKSNIWRSVFLWLNMTLNLRRKL